jgi:hypothetical protein
MMAITCLAIAIYCSIPINKLSEEQKRLKGSVVFLSKDREKFIRYLTLKSNIISLSGISAIALLIAAVTLIFCV